MSGLDFFDDGKTTMTQDLTKLTTPFGLLDEATQTALREHGGPYEIFFVDGWRDTEPLWTVLNTYRVKPQPPKPREWWINTIDMSAVRVNPADRSSYPNHIHVREVLDND